MGRKEHHVQCPVFGAPRWLAMAEERYDALLQYVNDWGRREPEANGDAPPEERPRQEDKAPPVEWPFLDLGSVFLELTACFDPGLALEALQELPYLSLTGSSLTCQKPCFRCKGHLTQRVSTRLATVRPSRP